LFFKAEKFEIFYKKQTPGKSNTIDRGTDVRLSV